MNQQSDWNPDQYLQFRNERTQPSIDLVRRINFPGSPEKIIDIGCGPGNSTQVLLQRWPDAICTGIDNSPAMIEKAKKDFPGQEWILSDALHFESDHPFDILFSNAAIQWIPNHKKLFDKLTDMLSKNGVIAIQIPKFQDMVLGQILQSVSGKKRWKKKTEGCSELFTYHDFTYYYDLLADQTKQIDMWETDYMHVMPSHAAIIEWSRSTGLKPYLDRMADEKEKKDFEEDLLTEIKKQYPKQKNSHVLFPFKRLFFIGYK